MYNRVTQKLGVRRANRSKGKKLILVVLPAATQCPDGIAEAFCTGSLDSYKNGFDLHSCHRVCLTRHNLDV